MVYIYIHTGNAAALVKYQYPSTGGAGGGGGRGVSTDIAAAGMCTPIGMCVMCCSCVPNVFLTCS